MSTSSPPSHSKTHGKKSRYVRPTFSDYSNKLEVDDTTLLEVLVGSALQRKSYFELEIYYEHPPGYVEVAQKIFIWFEKQLLNVKIHTFGFTSIILKHLYFISHSISKMSILSSNNIFRTTKRGKF